MELSEQTTHFPTHVEKNIVKYVFEHYQVWTQIFVSKTWLELGQRVYESEKSKLLREIHELEQSYHIDVLRFYFATNKDDSLSALEWVKVRYMYEIEQYEACKVVEKFETMLRLLSRDPNYYNIFTSIIEAAMETVQKQYW